MPFPAKNFTDDAGKIEAINRDFMEFVNSHILRCIEGIVDGSYDGQTEEETNESTKSFARSIKTAIYHPHEDGAVKFETQSRDWQGFENMHFCLSAGKKDPNWAYPTAIIIAIYPRGHQEDIERMINLYDQVYHRKVKVIYALVFENADDPTCPVVRVRRNGRQQAGASVEGLTLSIKDLVPKDENSENIQNFPISISTEELCYYMKEAKEDDYDIQADETRTTSERRITQKKGLALKSKRHARA